MLPVGQADCSTKLHNPEELLQHRPGCGHELVGVQEPTGDQVLPDGQEVCTTYVHVPIGEQQGPGWAHGLGVQTEPTNCKWPGVHVSTTSSSPPGMTAMCGVQMPVAGSQQRNGCGQGFGSQTLLPCQ